MSAQVLVALNNFKGTLTNKEASLAASSALKDCGVEHTVLPISDGGRGSQEMVQAHFGGDSLRFDVTGPLNKPVKAKALALPNRKKPKTPFIESSESCGYHLVEEKDRDALRATSRGLGEQILQAYQRFKSIDEIYIGLGDSIISDAGMGMLCGLGYKFKDKGGQEIWGNGDGLRQIQTIEIPKDRPWENTQFTVLCDVLNPLCGPQGSAVTFAPQKGAKPGQVRLLEEGMENFGRLAEQMTSKRIRSEPMTGSAGGLSSALLAFLNARLVHGARFLLDWIKFNDTLSECSLLITGEGKLDRQTLSGKAPFECLERARSTGKKAILFAGALGNGCEALVEHPNVLGCHASGMDPNPKKALTNKVQEVFEAQEIRQFLKSAG